jgi:hypothetical protein
MKSLNSIKRRLDLLQPETINDCPRCRALEAMTEAALDRNIALVEQGIDTLPAPTPTCPFCRKVAAMTEEELDAHIARMKAILADYRESEEETARKEAQSFCDVCGHSVGKWWCWTFKGEEMQKTCRLCSNSGV